MLLTPQDTLMHDFAAFINSWIVIAEISGQQKLLPATGTKGTMLMPKDLSHMLSVQKLSLGLHTWCESLSSNWLFPSVWVGLPAVMCHYKVLTPGCKAEELFCGLSYTGNRIRHEEL